MSKVDELADAFEATVSMNPSDEMDLSTELQQFLAASAEADELSADEIEELALKVGIPPEKLADFNEALSGWL